MNILIHICLLLGSLVTVCVYLSCLYSLFSIANCIVQEVLNLSYIANTLIEIAVLSVSFISIIIKLSGGILQVYFPLMFYVMCNIGLLPAIYSSVDKKSGRIIKWLLITFLVIIASLNFGSYMLGYLHCSNGDEVTSTETGTFRKLLNQLAYNRAHPESRPISIYNNEVWGPMGEQYSISPSILDQITHKLVRERYYVAIFHYTPGTLGYLAMQPDAVMQEVHSSPKLIEDLFIGLTPRTPNDLYMQDR